MGRLHGMTKKDGEAGAHHWLEVLGLAEHRHPPTETPTHGKPHRVQLAAALIHDAELLVLDEPLSGLDPIGVDTMAEILRSQARAGKAVVFSSHQLDLVEDLCDDVAIINRGRIVVSGNVKQLKDAAPL